MTSQQSNPAGSSHRAIDLFAYAATTDGQTFENAPSFGKRLRGAREARGLDIETCAHALKLPARVLRQLEGDEREGIDYAVYLVSYITKYARYLGVDEDAVQAELAALKRATPVLVATGGMSHSRYLLERYATAATYVVLTAVIVVPMVWLGVRGTLDRDLSHFAPLDASPVAQQDAPARTGSSALAAATPPAAKGTTPPAEEQPLLASMAPFPSLESPNLTADKPAPAISVPAPAAAVAGGHSLSLSLEQASWVEVVAADGSRLEYGLLPAGISKTFQSEQPLDVRIGNATGAQVSIDGQPVGLDAFRHANVAHFRVQDGKPSPAGA
jgi:cytoskeleton protein RodZ